MSSESKQESSDRKQIVINPDHFKVSGTRKKRSEPKEPKIKVKSPAKKEKKVKSSTLKKSLVKMLRSFQEDQQKKRRKQTTSVFSGSNTNSPSIPETGNVKSDFENSIDFFDSLEKTKVNDDKIKARHNYTLRAPVSPSSQSFVQLASSVMNRLPSNVVPVSTVIPSNQSIATVTPPPYGCLKNGNLPTYRNWKRQTQRQYPTIPTLNSTPTPRPPRLSSISIPPSPIQVNYETQLKDKIREMTLHEQHRSRKHEQQNKDKIRQKENKPKRQRRILRRTYRTGKSKLFPKVSVLVSNKTLRNNTNLQIMNLRETPIREVKQYLKKQGLIKVGTSTPNDVLRQMYECANLICGEVKNQSSENLLYNYFNDIDEKH
jgi:hypothetical protein